MPGLAPPLRRLVVMNARTTLLFVPALLLAAACAAPTETDSDEQAPTVEAPTVRPAATIDRWQEAAINACYSNCSAQYSACLGDAKIGSATYNRCTTANATCIGTCATMFPGVTVY